MAFVAELQMERIGGTAAMANHDHELNKLVDGIWRYDQYIANAQQEDKPQLASFWRDLKQQDEQAAERLRELIREEVRAECF